MSKQIYGLVEFIFGCGFELSSVSCCVMVEGFRFRVVQDYYVIFQ
jgi:hypothetical protein